jgi:hypothetical protein
MRNGVGRWIEIGIVIIIARSDMEKEVEHAQLSDLFNRAERLCTGFSKDELCDETHYREAIACLMATKQLVVSHSLFSPNDDFTEIKTENLK